MFDMPEVKPNVSIIAYRRISDGVFDVSAVVSHDDRDTVADRFRDITKGRMALVAGSYRSLKGIGDKRCRFAARSTSTFKPYADVASMTELGNGDFVDTAENIWNVLQDGDERYLVLQSKDDLADILEQFKARKGLAITASHLTTPVEAHPGDFASVIDDSGALAYGFIGHKDKQLTLFDVAKQTAVPFKPENLIEAYYDDERRPDIATLQSGDMQKIWAYLSKVFPAEYIKQYKAAVGA